MLAMPGRPDAGRQEVEEMKAFDAAGETATLEVDGDSIGSWIIAEIAEIVGVDPVEIDVHKPIAAYGVDSAEVAALVGELEDRIGRSVPVDLVWEWASVREVSARLADYLDEG
jgi:acyl carrier protein